MRGVVGVVGLALLLVVAGMAMMGQGREVAAPPPTTYPGMITLAFAGVEEGTGMAVSWSTVTNTTTSTVKYGLQSGVYDYTATGYSVIYYVTYIHHVVLEGLKPATTYYYVCGDESGGFSEEYVFTTAPGQFVPFTTTFYGDLGLINGNETRAALVANLNTSDWHYHVGDYSYADDGREKNFESTWDDYQTEMQPITAYKPYMTCPGNHEAACHSFGNFFCPKELNNFTSYQNRFRMPSLESGATGGNMWYSFNYSYVHFVSIDTETDFPKAPEGVGTFWNAGPFGDQLGWLEADLQRADAARQNNEPGAQPWIIVIGHRPLYSSKSSDYPPDAKTQLRAAVEELFHTYHVDLYICGHVHAYERMYPIYQDVKVTSSYDNPQATTFIVIGDAGNVEGLSKSWLSETPDWLAYRYDEDFGYAHLQVENATALHWNFYRSSDSTLMDQFTLTRSAPWF